ncbi:MAG: NAD(P)H-dependent oxidoreductase subunit E [Thermoguttaceae bacterium]
MLTQFSLDAIIAEVGGASDAALPILQAIQRHYRFLPEDVLRNVVRKTKITAAGLYGMATFYDQFRLTRVGEHFIHVCTGTACHVKGADRVLDAFRHCLNIEGGHDTDAAGKYTIQKVACLGCCTLAPVVQIDRITYGHVTPAGVGDILDEFSHRAQTSSKEYPTLAADPHRVATFRIGMGSCCQAQGSADVCSALRESVYRLSLGAKVEEVGCVGMCHQTPIIETISQSGVHTLYAKVTVDDVADIVHRAAPTSAVSRWQHSLWRCLESLWSDEVPNAAEAKRLPLAMPAVNAFRSPQRHLAMEHCGELSPTNLSNYREHGGFAAIENVLTMTPNAIVEHLKASGLRGRGGAGYPTALKWFAVQTADELNEDDNENDNAESSTRYVICNGDEGDPGAFMDRMLLESFPFRIIEGMMIAARAVGATHGIFYIRAEYPLAVERVRRAVNVCEEHGLLGKNILGSDFSFDIEIKEGAGAFVCGEETALLESLEGKRGTPRLRPPYPARVGLWGKPTLINNVETLALVPFIFKPSSEQGVESFTTLGTPKSRGTKVFALAGKVARGGLIEVPMGITIDEVVSELGGGVAGGKRFKAVQIGGPSGGCIPSGLSVTAIDFESLTEAGAMMGSGGLVVLDEGDCMVDMARYFLRFTQEQSCGKCTFCRIGTRRMLEILDALCDGKASRQDLETLETLAHQVQSASLCGLGRTAPNPVISTLRYFRDEYNSHIEGRCPAGKCPALVTYSINDKCTGCTLCSSACATGAITPQPYRQHRVESERCTRCGECRKVCPEQAIEVK